MKYFFPVILFTFFAACTNNKKDGAALEKKEDNMVEVESDDKKMNAAIEYALHTYDGFLSKLNEKGADCDNFSVKVKFPREDGISGGEHMWVSNLFYTKKNELAGTLNNDPLYVKSVKADDTIVLTRDKISDWMYVCNKKLVGGYTIMAVYDRLNDEEKKEFREGLPFELE